MNDSGQKETCSRCGATVAPGTLKGLCPACLLALNLTAPTEVPNDEAAPGGTQVVSPPPPPAPSPEEIGKLLPHLEILACLGHGGMGAVYKARQPKLDRFVAVKVLLRRHEGAAADAAFAERFGREARALARLNHPDIVAVYDYGEAGGYPYLIMEYVDGLTLRQLLHGGKLAPEQALAIVPRICEALQFAHQQGVVHRDIKPENILIDKRGQVKIADFGIAKILAPGAQDLSLTGGKDVVGTPHYMAPEQIEQPAKVDHRADIFSLGVVFYEMLTGELPLGKFQPPSRKVRVDVRLDEIVLHALEKEPERRYQHASQIKSDVETIAATVGADAGAGGATGSAPRAEAGAVTATKFETPPPQAGPGWANAARWAARSIGSLWGLVFLAFLVGEGSPPMGTQPFAVQAEFAALALMLAGIVAGWWRDCWAALLTLGGWLLFHLAESRVPLWSLFHVPVIAGVLFAFSWAARLSGRRPWALAGGAVALPLLFALVVNFLPPRFAHGALVTVSGSVTDALTGKPVAGARVDDNRYGASPRKAPRQAWTGTNGLYSLQTYYEEHTLAASAPGYVPALALLLTKPFGLERNVHLNFKLRPVPGQGSPTTPDLARAVDLFNEIEDFPHEFEAAFASTNLAAAQTGIRRFRKLATNFNAAVRGTDCEFPAAMLDDIQKVQEALDAGDWEKARLAGARNEDYARTFKHISNRMVEIARRESGASQSNRR